MPRAEVEPMSQAAGVAAPAVAAEVAAAMFQAAAAEAPAEEVVVVAALVPSVTIDPDRGKGSEPRTGDAMFAIRAFFDVDQRDLDPTAAL